MSTSLTRNPFSLEEVSAVGVTLENFSKSYGQQEVLKNINLHIEPGEIFVLMGPSGSGKSVILKHIIGLESPTSGQVHVDSQEADDPETKEDVRMALVFQAGALFNSLSVYDNLALYLREHRLGNEEEIRSTVTHALQILSLEQSADKFPSELSGGMRKRVSIARALVMRPQLILYDEPTSELDPIMAATISEVIASLKAAYRVTSIVVSHDRALALNIADRIAILMDGEIITVATPDELRASSDPRVTEFLNPTIDLENPRYRKLEK